MTAAAAVLAVGLTANPAVAAEAKAPTPGFRKCYDLDCKRRIMEGRSFNANGDYGITRVTIVQAGLREIGIRHSGPGTSGGCSGTPPLNCTINGVDVRAWAPERNTAMFRFNP